MEEQQDWIQQLVARSIQSAVAQLATQSTTSQQNAERNPPSDGPPTSEDIRITTESSGAPRYDDNNGFKLDVVGYFHPDLPIAYSKDDMVQNGKETVYRDVHVFVDRLNDMIPVFGTPTIRLNLVKCLRGGASAWYSAQLSALEKEGLRHGDGIKNWTEHLIKKFRESPTVALIRLTRTRYTTNDARQKHEPADYV